MDKYRFNEINSFSFDLQFKKSKLNLFFREEPKGAS